ncbi:MAG TPA: polysaccharide deacetylase family protein [Gemmatimonadales bacterium]|nr:polysaccharide deacetylase family protein [Gemmatimonadales bacterium]
MLPRLRGETNRRRDQVAARPPRLPRLRVLCYHAITDTAGDATTDAYCVPPRLLRAHLDVLQRSGYHFVGADQFLQFLDGRHPLPRRPVLLTFDDCYRDLAESALPLLQARGIPAVAFAVSGYLGATNRWDETIGARTMPLLDVAGLRELTRNGIEIGAHSHSHPRLTTLSDPELRVETAGAVEQLRRAGLGPVRLFAYPYGNYDMRVRHATRDAGVRAAFGTSTGTVAATDDPFALHRIQVRRADVGWRFQLKVALAEPLGGMADLATRTRARAQIRTRLRRLQARWR